MNTIENKKAKDRMMTGSLVIIDVREPGEYHEGHIPGALNFPSTNFHKDHYSGFKQIEIALVCQSGKRARKIGETLSKEGFEKVNLLETQMQEINNSNKVKGWSIDRQFRITLGVLLLVYLLLIQFVNYIILIPIILSSGLIITAIIDRCYLRMGIAMLPWNKGKQG